MAGKNLNYGTFVNTFKFSESLDSSVKKNLHVYASLFSKVSNISNVVDYALTVNDYNKPSPNDGDLNSLKSPKSILDFRVLYLVLKPNLILSLNHVLHSIARALINVLNGKPISSNFTTEVAFNLSGSSHVGRCMENVLHSKNDKPSSVLIVTLCQRKSSQSILDIVQGDQDNLDNLKNYSKVDDIIKEFKISEEELNLPGGLEASVLGKIGIKRI